MRIMTFIVLALFMTTAATAQEETILGEKEFVSGGYGALVTKLTPVNGSLGVLLGGRGGWIINHSIVLGCAGYGLVNNINANTAGPLGEQFLNLGYGGLDLEVVANSDRLVHYSVHTLIGGGAVSFRNGWFDNMHYDGRNQDGFFVFEPGANLDVNITNWFRTSLGVDYRVVSGISSDASSNSDLSGPSGQLSFRFGSF